MSKMTRIYPSPAKDRKRERKLKKHRKRRWHVFYNLAYDGGGSEWWGYYRTYAGARISIFWNVHFASWGGTADLKDMGVDWNA